MAANEGDKGDDRPEDRRSPPAGSRRKTQPITIDLAASSVRLENPTGPTPEAQRPTVEPTEAPVAAGPVVETPAADVPVIAGEPTDIGPEPSSPVNPEPVATVEPAAEPIAEAAAMPVNDPISEQPAATAEALIAADTAKRASARADDARPDDAKPAFRGPGEPPCRDTVPQTIAASLVGGAIGLIAAYGLASLGLWPGQGAGPTNAQVAALESRVAAAEAKVGPNGQLSSELDHLKSMPTIPGVTISDVEKILDPFTAKTTAAVAHVDDVDRKIAGEQAIVRGEVKASQEALVTKMTALENAVSSAGATANTLKDDIAKLQQDVAGLDRKTADALAAAQTQLSTTVQSLAARVNDLDTKTAAELAIIRGGASKTSEAIAKDDKSITDLTTGAATLQKTLTDQAEGIAKLQAQLAPMDDMRKAIDGLGGRIGAVDDVKKILEQQTTKLNTADDAKKAADGVAASLWIIDQRMANIQAKLAEIDTVKTSLASDAKDIQALQTRVAPMETTVAGLDGFARQGLDARKDAIAAVAISNLRTAAETGLPFANELAAAKAIVGKTVDLAALDVYAAGGLVPAAKLVEGFGPAARRITDALTPAATNDGIFGALLSHAVGSVKVMPESAQPGDSAPARLSRIDAKLKAHDFAGALSDWQALPEAGRKASADWGGALKTHVDGAKAVAAVSDAVMTKLTSVSQ